MLWDFGPPAVMRGVPTRIRTDPPGVGPLALMRGVWPLVRIAVVDTDLLLHTVVVTQSMSEIHNVQGIIVGDNCQPQAHAQIRFETYNLQDLIVGDKSHPRAPGPGHV